WGTRYCRGVRECELSDGPASRRRHSSRRREPGLLCKARRNYPFHSAAS
ncbi:hypothetical protein EVAR_72301_1, partial [Eumeta japonica]